MPVVFQLHHYKVAKRLTPEPDSIDHCSSILRAEKNYSQYISILHTCVLSHLYEAQTPSLGHSSINAPYFPNLIQQPSYQGTLETSSHALLNSGTILPGYT